METDNIIQQSDSHKVTFVEVQFPAQKIENRAAIRRTLVISAGLIRPNRGFAWFFPQK
jgi:hypothetical protein